MADRKLTFPERGVAVSLCDSSPDPDLIQARVTVDETLTIPPFSMLETMARVNGKVQGQTWLLQECRTKQLPVKIANGLVSSTCDQVPVQIAQSQSRQPSGGVQRYQDSYGGRG